MDTILKFFEKWVDFFNYLKIAASPTLIGVVIGVIVYCNKADSVGLTIAIVICICGLLFGIFLANWAKRKVGTTEFITRINASPDIDEVVKDKK